MLGSGATGGCDGRDYNNAPCCFCMMNASLEPVLFLLAAAVLVVAACRSFNLPPVTGYLLVGAWLAGIDWRVGRQ